MNAQEAWSSFSTGDNNQDPGGSWLYSFRYSEADLRNHQQTIIDYLQEMGMVMFEHPEGGLALASSREITDEERVKVNFLAEELTVTNEALENSHLELHNSSIIDLTKFYKIAFLQSLASGNKDLAVGLLRIEMPQLVSDMSRAQNDNQPLSPEEYAAVTDLGDYIARKNAILMDGDAIVTQTNFGPTQYLTFDDLTD